MASKKQFSFWQKIVSPIVLWNVGGMVVFVLAVLIGVWIWLDNYTRHGESVAVPDLEGMSVESASLRLTDMGLEVDIADSVYDENYEPGKVMSQHPKSGNRVKRGRQVRLTVSSGSAPQIVLPELSSRNQAEMTLRAMGFKLIEVETTPGDKDWIYSVKVNGKPAVEGQKVRINATVTLVVGDGSTNPDYVQPDTISGDDEFLREIIRDLY